MFIFGSKSRVIRSTPVNTTCVHCNQTEHTLHVWQKYAHLFWMPMFPLSKSVEIACDHCKCVTEQADIPKDSWPLIKEEKRAAQTSARTFAGWIPIALIAATHQYATFSAEKDSKIFRANPAAHDIAVVKTEENEFQLIKLHTVSNDKIQLKIGRYAYRKLGDAKRDIKNGQPNKAGYFSDDIAETTPTAYQEIEVKFVHRKQPGFSLKKVVDFLS